VKKGSSPGCRFRYKADLLLVQDGRFDVIEATNRLQANYQGDNYQGDE
jgi:hypothetical protein